MVDAIRTGKRAKAALAVASLVGLGGSAAHAATISSASVNFNNGATDITNNFNQETNGVASTGFSWGATAGILDQAGPSAGGAVVGSTTDDTLVYNQGSFDPTNGNTINLSLLYLRGNTTAGNKIQLGLLGGANQSFNGGTNDVGFNFISARVVGGGTDLINAQSGIAAPGVAAATANIGTNTAGFAYTIGHWYKLNVSITESNTTTGTFTVGSSIVDFGTAGTTAGATVSTFGGGTFTDSNLIGNTALWAGFRDSGEGTATASSAFLSVGDDNFNVNQAPEPASIALLALGGLAGLSRRRRRV